MSAPQSKFVEDCQTFISHLQRAWLEGDGQRVVYVTDRANRDALTAATKYLLCHDEAFRYVLCEFFEQGAGPETNTILVHLYNPAIVLPS